MLAIFVFPRSFVVKILLLLYLTQFFAANLLNFTQT